MRESSDRLHQKECHVQLGTIYDTGFFCRNSVFVVVVKEECFDTTPVIYIYMFVFDL